MPPFVLVSLVLSTLVLAGIWVGVALRRDRRRHIPIMVTCGIVDIALVAAIVVARNAIPQALEARTGVLRVHLAFSVPALLGWFTAFASGAKRRKGKWIAFHRWNAIVFLVARTGNWITSFFVYDLGG